MGGKRGGGGTGKGKKKNSLRSKLKKKIASKTLKGKLAAKGITKKTVADKKKKISASSSRKQVRQNTKEKIATRKKIRWKSIIKAVKNLTKGAPAKAATTTPKSKPKSKLQTQLSNLRSRIKQQSTPEAKKKRRADRLRRQHGLDYSRMNPSFKIDASIDQAAQKLGIRNHPLYQKYVPKDVKNWKFKYQTQAPTKLGAADGYTRNSRSIAQAMTNARFDPNRVRTHEFRDSNRDGIDDRDQGIVGPITGGKNQEAARREAQLQEEAARRQQLADRIARSSHPEFVHSRREAAGLPSLRQQPMPIDTEQIPPGFGLPIRGIPDRGRPPRGGPQQDWLSQLYSSHNINQGKLDQGARDYWSNEAKTKGRDAVMQSIIGTSKAQGTYGGRKKPQRIDTGRTPRPWFGDYHRGGRGKGGGVIGTGMRLLGSASNAKRAQQKHASQKKSYDLQNKGYKRRAGMIAKSIAATMAARGI